MIRYAGFLCVFLIISVSLAGIPEPDVVLYGGLCIDGVPQGAADPSVVVRASVSPRGSEQVVGHYRMGDSTLGGDFYYLRIRRESGVDGSTQGDNAAREGQVVTISVQVGVAAPVNVATMVLPAMGTIDRLNLLMGDSIDIDGDNDNNLLDFGKFQNCFTGPGGSVSPGCGAADLDNDTDVDLDDFKPLVIFQETCGS